VSGQDCGAGLPAERIALRINAALPPGRPDSSRLGRLTYHASHVDPVPSTPNRPKVKSPIDFHYLGSRDRRLRSQDSFAVDFRGGPLFPPKHARAWRPECGTGSEVTAVPAVSATANPGSISVYVKRESLPLSAVIVKHHETEKRDEGSFVAADVSSQSAPSPLAQLSSSMTNGLRDRGTLPVPSEAHLIPRQLGRTESRASSGFAQFAQFPQWGSDVYEWWTLNHLILRSTPEACVSKDGNTQGARARQRYGSYSALIETRLSRFRRFAPKRRRVPLLRVRCFCIGRAEEVSGICGISAGRSRGIFRFPQFAQFPQCDVPGSAAFERPAYPHPLTQHLEPAADAAV
jgi:hypothetical protein